MTQKINVRIAPSPTGYLHPGNMRTALINYLFARKHGGAFVLRLDDTDTERSRPEFEDAIYEDMRWLGLEWDSRFKQSQRLAEYETAKNKLIAGGRLYACYETAEELDIRRKMQSGRGLPPIYDRAALKLSAAQKAEFEAQGRKPHWRFLLNDTDLVWHDLIRGEVRMKASHMSDPVLVRADGVPLYTLASVVDDGQFETSHIIRGEDHVSNTAVQVQIFEALGFALPQFGHMALLKTKDGELSKRTGGNDIRSLREKGILPMAVNSLLAKIGTSDAVEPFATMEELVAGFDIGKLGRAPANYDPAELDRLNEKLLHLLPFARVKEQLPAGSHEAFWNSVRGNVKCLAEAHDWWAILHGEVARHHSAGDAAFIAEAATLLPPEPWNEQSWGVWTKALSEKTGRKGKALFLPLRLALTGMEHGPEMGKLLPLLGRDKAAKRLCT